MTKDKKKGIGFIIMAIVSAVCAILCFTLGYLPAWVSPVCSAIGGICATFGIYWVTPVESLVKGETVLKIAPNVGKSVRKTGSKLFSREGLELRGGDKNR